MFKKLYNNFYPKSYWPNKIVSTLHKSHIFSEVGIVWKQHKQNGKLPTSVFIINNSVPSRKAKSLYTGTTMHASSTTITTRHNNLDVHISISKHQNCRWNSVMSDNGLTFAAKQRLESVCMYVWKWSCNEMICWLKLGIY